VVTYPGGSGTATNFYDPANNITQTVFSGGPTLVYTYDDAGRLVTAHHVALAYDSRGDITNSQDGAASFGASYDPGRRLKTVTYDGQATVTYTYDERNLLTRAEDNLVAAWLTFTYDAGRRLTRIQRSNGVATDFTYDHAGRVIRIQDGTLGDQQYTLDAEGEPTRVVRDVPLTSAFTTTTRSLTFDEAAQISGAGYGYDARGRQTAAPGVTYTYDGANRLTQVSSGNSTSTFTYNDLGDLRTRTNGSASTTYYHNYAMGLAPTVAEKDGAAYRRFYVYSPGGCLLYSMESAASALRFYHFDRIGSTLFLTDGTGTVSAAYAYDPYGRVVGRTGTNDQPFTFIGAYGVRAEPLGPLYDMRARYYDPETTRFLTRDPLWPELSDLKALNPYQYADRNPISFLDPLGLETTAELEQRIADLERQIAEAEQAANAAEAEGERAYQEYQYWLDKMNEWESSFWYWLNPLKTAALLSLMTDAADKWHMYAQKAKEQEQLAQRRREELEKAREELRKRKAAEKIKKAPGQSSNGSPPAGAGGVPPKPPPDLVDIQGFMGSSGGFPSGVEEGNYIWIPKR
jgi:RHS repeat-associated protein